MPRDAERWLAERGVSRDPIRVPARVDGPGASPPSTSTVRQAGDDLERPDPPPGTDAAPPSTGTPPPGTPPGTPVDEAIADALAFIRRSTAVVPQAEGRLRAKLADRDVSTEVVEQALVHARAEGLVDDATMAAALVEERRAKGHAVSRIRRDLRVRGFDDSTLDDVLVDAEAEDPEAAAFAVARARAEQLRGVDTEAAFRRVVGYLARRGHPDGLSRKVARQAVFATRDDERI